MGVNVALQLEFESESFSADMADMWCNTSMNKCVKLHPFFADKSLVAVLTFVWTFPCMETAMSLERAELCKSTTTNIANERLLTSVTSSVTDQDIFLCKRHRTEITFERPNITMYTNVLHQICVFEKPFLALWTFIIPDLGV